MAIKMLTPEHMEAIGLLALPKRGGLTYEEIADRCNVHPNTLYAWRKDPMFQAAYKKEIVRGTQDRLSEMMHALIDTAINDGNAAAAKIVLTANDMLTTHVEVTGNTNEGKTIEEMQERIARYKSDHASEE